MLDKLKEIILDYQELKLEPGISRQLEIKEIPTKATVCIGVRRSGKSTFMFRIMQLFMG
ncbi:MAG: hypothetical protein HY559_00555 [Gammaproteobacteria bacterium]|nr:hypothetical protein [Gammaproteobacteria bacterium]